MTEDEVQAIMDSPPIYHVYYYSPAEKKGGPWKIWKCEEKNINVTFVYDDPELKGTSRLDAKRVDPQPPSLFDWLKNLANKWL